MQYFAKVHVHAPLCIAPKLVTYTLRFIQAPTGGNRNSLQRPMKIKCIVMFWQAAWMKAIFVITYTAVSSHNMVLIKTENLNISRYYSEIPYVDLLPLFPLISHSLPYLIRLPTKNVRIKHFSWPFQRNRTRFRSKFPIALSTSETNFMNTPPWQCIIIRHLPSTGSSRYTFIPDNQFI